MKARPISSLRFVAFPAGLLGALFVARAIHDRKLNVALGKGTSVVVTQVSDPVVYWGIVLLISLLTAALFYCAFFAKDKPNA
jgi:hypothetical protein